MAEQLLAQFIPFVFLMDSTVMNIGLSGIAIFYENKNTPSAPS
jgi:hypothetical protein